MNGLVAMGYWFRTINYQVAQHAGTTQGCYAGYTHVSLLLEDGVLWEDRDGYSALCLPNTELHSWLTFTSIFCMGLGLDSDGLKPE